MFGFSRLPGPSRVPAAGSGASRSPGSSNLNRRSQSFNSIDKGKPLQYASGNDRGESKGDKFESLFIPNPDHLVAPQTQKGCGQCGICLCLANSRSFCLFNMFEISSILILLFKHLKNRCNIVILISTYCDG